MTLSIVGLIVGGLLGCLLAACHLSLKTFSRSRFVDLYERAGETPPTNERLDTVVPDLQLTTAALRTLMGAIVVLSLLWLTRETMPELAVWMRYIVALGLSAAVLTIFFVAIPTSWSRYGAEPTLRAMWGALLGLRALLGPLLWVLRGIDPVVRRISGFDLDKDEADLGDEVIAAVEDHESGRVIDEEQKEMLEAVFDLPNTTAGEVMTPRTEIKGIDIGSSLPEVQERLLAIGHSRVPVYAESLDHIKGLLYAKDLLRFLGDGHEFCLADVVREAMLVPESKPVSDLLREFRSSRVHIAIVLDEYGGTAGLVTVEDILEEIVGEIQDEYELTEQPEPIAKIDDGTLVVDAAIDFDDLLDEIEIEEPEEVDFDTLRGFVYAQLGRIPEAGETFHYDGFRFVVTEAEKTRVNRVRIEKLTEDERQLAFEDLTIAIEELEAVSEEACATLLASRKKRAPVNRNLG
ncbi:MAG: hemolysin family protein, partial [Planctomycetota bacterium]